MTELTDELRAGDVSLLDLAMRGLVPLKIGPERVDDLTVTAESLARAIIDGGLDLAGTVSERPTISSLREQVWLPRLTPSDRSRQLHDLNDVKDWTANRAADEARKAYISSLAGYRRRLELYEPASNRAHELRTQVISMDILGATTDLEMRRRLIGIQQKMLEQVELAIYQLEGWIGPAPLRQSGRDFQESLIASLTGEIEDAATRDAKHVTEAEPGYQLLQDLLAATGASG